jgi:hypothetical protein
VTRFLFRGGRQIQLTPQQPETIELTVSDVLGLHGLEAIDFGLASGGLGLKKNPGEAKAPASLGMHTRFRTIRVE